MNSLFIEEELNGSVTVPSPLDCTSKISSLIWNEHKATCEPTRYFLNVGFGFINGLMHVYELKQNQLFLIGRLYLPKCKHRWLTSFAVIAIKNSDIDQSSETIFLTTGDKNGNLYLYSLTNKLHFSELDESFKEKTDRLTLLEPLQAFKNLVKDKLSISSIYTKRLSEGRSYLVICCCKDGYYRVFEFNINVGNNRFISTDESSSSEEPICALKLINKYQVNSYVDLIESFIFD